MQQENPTPRANFEQSASFNVKKELVKYLRYWPWYVIGLALGLTIAYFYIRYQPRSYQTQAKIKLLDQSDGMDLPGAAMLMKRSNVNIDNEIEILKSYLIVEKVVKKLRLNTSFYDKGNIQTSQLKSLPFLFNQKHSPDSVAPGKYEIRILENKLQIENIYSEAVTEFPSFSTFNSEHNLPFEVRISPESKAKLSNKTYIVVFSNLKDAVMTLKGRLSIGPLGKRGNLLSLRIQGQSKELSESILNTLIEVFNQDGIEDRQLVSKRTLEFIEDRFLFLSKELDSIETDRQVFKQQNNFVDLAADAQIDIAQETTTEQTLFEMENQLSLANFLDQTISTQGNSKLLPNNIGLDNQVMNTLIGEYNEAFLEKEKLKISGGDNNPNVKLAEEQLGYILINIKKSLKDFIKELEFIKKQIENRNKSFANQISQIPEKEKLFRDIERQQSIKENLYLFLLQKREEASISLETTEPTVKIVEFALSSNAPISPSPKSVYMAAIMLGLLLPFAVVYLIFFLDSKIHGKSDIEALNTSIPIVAEIPIIDSKKQSIVFDNPNDRSELSEAFRILSSNVNFMLPRDTDTGKVIFVTSTIKGEGKTFVALNLSLALSSINKKVLLIGADLRNPQLHSYLGLDKNIKGLSNYLHGDIENWKEFTKEGFKKHANHNMLLSGELPPNPAHLLTNGKFETLLNEAKSTYDYIVVDTAPSLLVTDTLLISQHADATIYVTRAGVTDQNLLEYSTELYKNNKLKNMGYVVNYVGHGNRSYGYNYGYNYGYGASKSQ
jgi:capsular exopolysaccharide synthesis family protein